jgi:hypothetical protein
VLTNPPRSAGIPPAATKMSDAITAESMVCDVISAHRGDGLARAFETAARVLGITARRARGFYHHEVSDPRFSEVERIRAGYANWLDAETRRLEARRATLLAYRDALRSSHEEIAGSVCSVAGPSMGRRRDDVPQTHGRRAG